MNAELYSVKSVGELKVKELAKEESKIALLVPTMFNKVSGGYYKKSSSLAVKVETISDEPEVPAPTVSENVTPVQPEPVSLQSVVSAQAVEETKTEVPKPEIPSVVPSEPNIQTQTPVSPTPEKQNNPSEEVVVPKQEVEKEKKYVEKAENLDVIFLANTKMVVAEPAKKLLISKVFIQKLINHRKASVDKAEKPEINKVEIADSPKDAAVKKYVELLKKRKEAIATKQQCEKEMTALVNEYNITLDLVNAELAKSGSKEVA